MVSPVRSALLSRLTSAEADVARDLRLELLERFVCRKPSLIQHGLQADRAAVRLSGVSESLGVNG